MIGVRGRIFLVLLLADAVVAGTGRALAAGSAYQVDTGLVGEPGGCKVDAWWSSAANTDLTASVAPSCVVDLGRAFDVSLQFSRSRSDDEWTSSFQPKVKTNIIPGGGVREWSVAVTGTAAYDATTRELSSLAFAVPATLRMSENIRLNVNAGYLRGLPDSRNFFTYGAGLDLRTSDNVWTLTAEAFGVGAVTREDDRPGDLRPRWQLGLRWRPVDQFNLDLIYGRNLSGESANWITLATTIRFKVGN